jgi:imidazolonepropionase-like amidohydrolase
MDLRQILASLTTAPAERFDSSKRLGRIAEGFLANLVVLTATHLRTCAPWPLSAIPYGLAK